jgi:hypothetical protein
MGLYRVTLYGVYDEAAYAAAFTAGRDPPSVDYTVGRCSLLASKPDLKARLDAEYSLETTVC